jgi:hypothetical protein
MDVRGWCTIGGIIPSHCARLELASTTSRKRRAGIMPLLVMSVTESCTYVGHNDQEVIVST